MTTLEPTTRLPRTSKCLVHASVSSRNLVVCIDGASNRFGIRNSNVLELFHHVTGNDKQSKYYISGLGAIPKDTGASLRHRLSNDLDMVFGRNLHKVIMNSYHWLSHNYQNGDRIFLWYGISFHGMHSAYISLVPCLSRAAYHVKALVGMIARVGLLLPGNNAQIPLAFDLYTKMGDELSFRRPENRVKYTELTKTFRETLCITDVHIHFVGVWDTLSPVGIGRSITLPDTTTSCEHVCYFQHALALDERRVTFLPEYVCDGRSSYSSDGRVKEVWFVGCHSDVGGINRGDEMLQSGDIPLMWMRSQAIAAGLEMEPAYVTWKLHDLDKQNASSLRSAWWLLELMPLRGRLYYNSDRQTSRPHFGGPRRILPGQKVHVSVLFKHGYKPRARFYDLSELWLEPIAWNYLTSHERLQNLPDLWEKDIFNESFVPTMLDKLQQRESILDVLDHLAFSPTFDIYKSTFTIHQDAPHILSTFLNSNDRAVRLSTAVAYCGLHWDWPLEANEGELGQQIVEDISELLNSCNEEDCHRACMCIPPLSTRTELRAGVISHANLKMLVKFCGNAHILEQEGSASAFHSAQALSALMTLHDEFAQELIDMELVTDITEVLRTNCSPGVIAAVLIVVDGLAKYENGRMVMKSGLIVVILLKLIKQCDDFVSLAATRVLCSLLPEVDLRWTMLRFGALSTFLDMLNRDSAEIGKVTCQALVEFVQFEKDALFRDGHLEKLAKRAQNHLPRKSQAAITALVTFGNAQVEKVGVAVTEAIKEAKTIPVLVRQLNHKSTALSAASALARLSKIDDVAIMVSVDASACVAFVDMLQKRWFDGVYGEDGLQVLSELLECEHLRTAILRAGAIKALRDMISSRWNDITYAGLYYLRVTARIDEDGSVLPRHDAIGLVQPVLDALGSPQWRVQRIAMEILRLLSVKEEPRAVIVQGLLSLLGDRRASVLLAASTVLGYLATDESVRERVLTEESFCKLNHDYYDGLNLEFNPKGGGPRAGEVYESIGHFIRLMQVHESYESRNEETEHLGGWTEPMLYEPKWITSGAY